MATTTYSKTEDGNLKVSTELYNQDGSTYIQDLTFSIKFLNSQKEAIIKQRDEMIAMKEKELSEVNSLLDECEKLEIV